ncbi:MAG: hypothetical protein JWP71_2741 [Mucilaginibacter sp.]|nr:hypothetical protein [Mucilaginibacter sp.]
MDQPSFPLAEERVALEEPRGESSPPGFSDKNAHRLLTRSLLRSTTLSSPLAERGLLRTLIIL